MLLKLRLEAAERKGAAIIREVLRYLFPVIGFPVIYISVNYCFDRFPVSSFWIAGVAGGLIAAIILFYVICITNDAIKQRKAVDEIFDMLHQKINRKNFCSFKITAKAREEIINDQYKVGSVYRIISSAMQYLKVPFEWFDVTLTADQSTEHNGGKFTAGQYAAKSGKSNIHITLKKEYTFENVMAIICHECTHHYLRIKGIRYEDTDKNELLTDVAAIYIGFGYYISTGYKGIEKTIRKGSDTYTQTTKIGYISQYQISHILGRIKKLRKIREKA